MGVSILDIMEKTTQLLVLLLYSALLRGERLMETVPRGSGCVAADTTGEFSVSDNYPATGTTVAATDIKIGDGDCAADFVHIPQGTLASSTTSAAKDRYCGQAFGGCLDATCAATATGRDFGAVTSSVIPFTLGVVTDSAETETGNRGFRLFFRQQPCA